MTPLIQSEIIERSLKIELIRLSDKVNQSSRLTKWFWYKEYKKQQKRVDCFIRKIEAYKRASYCLVENARNYKNI